MLATKFNSTQMYLLSVFANEESGERLTEIKDLITQYYQKKVDEKLNELWDNGILDQKRLDQLMTMDLHKDL